MLTEPGMPADPRSPLWEGREKLMVFVGVTLIGLIAGAFQGFTKGSMRHMWVQMGVGGALGAVGGLLGYSIGGMLVAIIFGADVFVRGAPIPITAVARMVAMTPLGLCLGAAIGATNLTSRSLMAGAIGGFVGGAIAGLLFDPVAFVLAPLKMLVSGTSEVGGPSRAATFLLIGFCVGLFTGLVDLLTRHAWVRLVLGRNEEREWPLDSQVTTFGRDERALVPLFGDSTVAPLHASVVRHGGDFVLHDAGTPVGVGLNGMRLAQPTALKPGDTFQIGTHQLQFLMKGHGAARGQEGRFSGVPTSPPSPQPNLVPSVSVTPVLVALTGPLTGSRFSVTGPLELGREAAGVSLTFDTQASRRHAVVTPGPSGLTVQDLGSTNGTMVNGQRVSMSALRPGDTLQIGLTSFRVE
jgi:pSer/pThr/pTyr-binding forkhead associated (FHA) protein